MKYSPSKHDYAEADDEIPSLAATDQSDASPRGGDYHCDESPPPLVREREEDRDRRRRRKKKSSSSRSESAPRSGSTRRGQRRSRSRPRQKKESSSSRSESASRSKSGRRSRSRPRSTSRRRAGRGKSSSRSHSRRSYHRCASSGGTTLYNSPHMKTLDDYLRSTSGLRLQMDGTCNFIFENQRFAIEMADDGTGDFILYSSFGRLKELQRRCRKRGNMLRMLAAWNEELKRRRGGDEQSSDKEGSYGESKGLLRIDSSKEDGPHVAFIYYGHINYIMDATHFQETVDDFVDDTLEFSARLHCTGFEEERDHVEAARSRSRTASSGRKRNPSMRSNSDVCSQFSKNSNKSSNSSSNKNEEAAALAAPAITASDVYHATAKKSVFAKMINSIRPRPNTPLVERNAYVDHSNPSCAFVVDREAAEEGNIKPTIVLSREGGVKASSFHSAPTSEREPSFHDRQRRSSYHAEGKPEGGGRQSGNAPFARSEPVGVSRRGDPDPAIAAPRRSRRRSSVTRDDRRKPVEGNRRRRSSSRGMSRSEPVVT